MLSRASLARKLVRCAAASNSAPSAAQQTLIDRGMKYGAHNYKPLPVVLEKGKGAFMYDTDGKEYFDFLSAYSAVNQGHCHPRIVGALKEQAEKICLTSRAFTNERYPDFCKFMADTFGYDR